MTTQTPEHPSSPRPRSAVRDVSILTVLHAAFVSVLLLLFAWPAATAEPRDLPIGIVGPAGAVDQISERIDAEQSGAIDLIAFSSVADAEAAIEKREIYGAIELSQEPRALVATAANPAVAQLVTDLTRTIASASAAAAQVPAISVDVVDVAPLAEADSRGAVFGTSALPLVIGGISLAALAALRLSSARARFTLVGIASITSGASLTAIMSGWLGALPGDALLTTIAMSATLAALAASIVGAHALWGMAGFGVLAGTLFLLGNPLNGVALPPEFYLGGWGAVGQAMPVGAGFDLLRSINYFPTADTGASWVVLSTWIIAGMVAIIIGALLRRQRAVAAS